jgi:hypothetical protein
MERVGTADRVRSTTGHGFGDPVGHVSRNMGDFGCPLVSKLVEEHVESSFAASRAGPDEAAGVVVNNNDQIPVSAFIGDLIDSDPPQTVKTIHPRFDIIVDSGDDRPDGPPCHP